MNDDRRARRRRGPLLGLGVVLCLATTGCGSYGNVSGKVSYKGEPLGGGTVLVFSEGNPTTSSVIGPDGAYRLDKVPVGPVRFAVETKSAQPLPAPTGAVPKDAAGPTAPPSGKYVAIPDVYSDPRGSGLTYTVQTGPQTHDIDLK